MGYEAIVLTPDGMSRLAAVELDMGERFDLERVAREQALAAVGALPGYWGDDTAVVAGDTLALLRAELAGLSDASEAEVRSAVAKLLPLVDLAISSGFAVRFVPD